MNRKCFPTVWEIPKRVTIEMQDIPAEAYKSMWKALEIMAVRKSAGLKISYSPGYYSSRFAKLWRIQLFGVTYLDQDPLIAIKKALIGSCTMMGWDIEKQLDQEEQAASDKEAHGSGDTVISSGGAGG